VLLPALVEPADSLTPDEVRRYSRHVLLPQLGVLGQRRLTNARVLVIGAGGLGSSALLYLAAAGVGTLGVVDFDVVEESNLQRQVVHRQQDLGRSKVASALRAIHDTNPLVRAVGHEVRLDASNALDLFAGYDLVLDGTDTFATRYLVSDAAVLLAMPYVWASIYRFDAQVSVFWPGNGPCYRCVFPAAPPPDSVPSCAEGGVLGALCGVIGALQATEAIKLITGIGDPLVGRLLVHDALGQTSQTLTVAPDPQCVACGEHPTMTTLVDHEPASRSADADAEISVQTLRAWLTERAAGARDFVLVDVREPQEYEINRIPGSVLVPHGEFLDGGAMAMLPADRPLVLHCKSGRRSAECLSILRAAGRSDVVHVAGGVIAWVEQVDPSQSSY
jgi:molybdopterin/thiamine biosynthesis adenylyltransferase/rhodanese-related sulfurtransferase